MAGAGLALTAGSADAFSGGTLISQGRPTYSSGTVVYAVKNMVDSSYDEYRCKPTCAGIIDISNVPVAERTNDVLTWYNEDNSFDNVAEGNYSYNEPRTFTIDANAAPGGGSPPTSGWQTLESVANNIYDAGQYVLSLSGYNWVRMQVTASNGSSQNTDAAWHLDVVSCSSICLNTGAAIDTWLFLGDSITNNSMFQVPTSPPNFMQQVNATATGFYPSQINGGMSFWQAGTFLSTDPASGEPYIEKYLQAFPAAHFVTLNLGTNDLNDSGSNYNDAATTSFENNMATLVQDVINAGRVPVVPTIPWAPTACDRSGALADNNPATSGTPNYWITHTLYATYPQVVHGPDLWTYFDQHQSLIATSGSPGCPHPTAPTGENDYRALWGSTMLSEVYVSSGPVVSFSPSGVSFGSEQVGTTSGLQSVTLMNSGNAALSIGSIGLAGADPGDFSQSNNCPSAPATLAAGSSCSISVTFTPSATGSRTASVQVTDNASDSPESVGLSGTGTAPAVTLAPSGGLSFGSELVGTTSAAQSVTLTNSGTAALSIGSIGLAGADPGDFSQSNNCPSAPATLAAGSSCSISVTFTPSAAGTRTANVSVTDNAGGSPQTAPLSGTGGTGGTGTIAFDKTLGQFGQNASGSTLKLTTTAAAATGARVFVFVDWWSASGTLSSLAGGGLSWSVDVQGKDTTNFHTAIASASAPSGLAANITLTATFSKSVTSGLIAAASFTGITSSSPLDVTGTNHQYGAAAWTGSVQTTNADDLVLGWSGIDKGTTDTAGSPNVKLFDFGNSAYGESATAEYQIDTNTGTQTVNGTWASTSGATANSTVVAAYKSS